VLDAEYFADLERDAPLLLARDLPALERAIGGSCRIKASVVERDEQEAELRHVLNYGHTIGHAIEAVTRYESLTHGEAVAVGMAAEATLALRLGIAGDDTPRRQNRLLAALGLPVRLMSLDPDAIVTAIGHDKKGRDGRVPFVLAPRIGEFKIVYDIAAGDVRAVLVQLGGQTR